MADNNYIFFTDADGTQVKLIQNEDGSYSRENPLRSSESSLSEYPGSKFGFSSFTDKPIQSLGDNNSLDPISATKADRTKIQLIQNADGSFYEYKNDPLTGDWDDLFKT